MEILFSTKGVLALIGAVLACVGNLAYIKQIWRGAVRPHPYTWATWSLVSLITFFGGLDRGAGIGIVPTGVSEGFTLMIFFIALGTFLTEKIRKKSFTRQPASRLSSIQPSDHIFFIGALLGLIPWALTQDPTLSVVIVVAIDLIAFIPTLKKTWKNPESEEKMLYGMNSVRHGVTLFALEAYNVATMTHSVAMIIVNMLMVAIIVRKRFFKKVTVNLNE